MKNELYLQPLEDTENGFKKQLRAEQQRELDNLRRERGREKEQKVRNWRDEKARRIGEEERKLKESHEARKRDAKESAETQHKLEVENITIAQKSWIEVEKKRVQTEVAKLVTDSNQTMFKLEMQEKLEARKRELDSEA